MENKKQQYADFQYTEDLLQSLTEDNDLIDNWYRAREYVGVNLMDRMCRMNAKGKFTKPLHIVTEGTSPLMCAIIREIILRAHYYDFDEETGDNASLITAHCKNEEKAKETLLNTPFLGNYLRYCWGTDGVEPLKFLDVFVEVKNEIGEDSNAIVLTDEDVNDFFNNRDIAHVIDTRRAYYANQAYNLGQELDNLPDINPTDVIMYEIPMTAFENKSINNDNEKKWNEAGVKDKLSNVFCTDTFDMRIKMLMRAALKTDCDKNVMKLNPTELKKLTREVENNILALSKCEHSRWIAEKLILDFRPWTSENHYEYSRMFDKSKKDYRKNLKNKNVHYDICSYRDICRRDPASRKYDTFLVLLMLNIDKMVNLSHKF